MSDAFKPLLARLADGVLDVHPGVGHMTPLLIPSALRAAVVSCAS